MWYRTVQEPGGAHRDQDTANHCLGGELCWQPSGPQPSTEAQLSSAGAGLRRDSLSGQQMDGDGQFLSGPLKSN